MHSPVAAQLLDGRAAFAEAWAAGLRPDEVVAPSTWVERAGIKLGGAEGASRGPLSLERTPYLRELLDCLTNESTVHSVAVMKASQLGFTLAEMLWAAYVAVKEPAGLMWVLPTDGLCKRHARLRLAPFFEDSPGLKDVLGGGIGAGAESTTLEKTFHGGFMLLCGANSPAGFRSTPCGKLILDEVDAFPYVLGEEGDPIELARRASRTFPLWKELLVSTPTIDGRSRIQTAYLEGDQRRYYVPCPTCQQFQVLVWQDRSTGRRGVRWEQRPDGAVTDVWYECEHCRARIEEGHRAWLLRNGEWRPRFPERSAEQRSYHLSSLYAPPGGKVSWRRMVVDFLRVKDNADKLRVWVNQSLGETFVEKGEAPPWEEVHRRAEPYRIGTVPRGGVVLTAGIDVQQDRLEVEVVAWGDRMESWSVSYDVLIGDTADEPVWQDLDRLVQRPFRMEGGLDLRIRLAGIDTGFSTQRVYGWARARSLRVAALKGHGTLGVLIGSPTFVDVTLGGRKLRRGVRLWPVGTSVAKRELYGALRLPRPKPGQPFPPGYAHFPSYAEAHFQGLCSEQLVARKDGRGFNVYEWRKVQERNEQLDCRVYARAAAAILGLDRYTAGDWARAAAGTPQVPSPPPAPPTSNGGLFARWRSPRTS